jgi:DNA-directed RNA polymerase subunit M/transcription elongation factor TFIIS
MDISFNCPRCNQHLAVEESGAGMTVNCPSCNKSIEIPQQVAAHSDALTDPDESYAALRSEPDGDPDAPWRAEPATDSQKRKLRFYGRRFPAQLTKGEASDLIEDAMEQHSEKEEVYQKWRQTEHDIADCFDEVETSDFYEEGDMRKPTREMIQETIAFLEANRPNWRHEVRGNGLAILLMERYPQLERMRRRPR